MSAASKPLRRSQAERRSTAERALLDAAARLFARKGVEATSLADIGGEAGYSRGLVTHHFGSRAALVKQLTERTERRFLAGLAPQDPTVDGVVSIAENYIDRLLEGTDESRAFYVMWGSSFPKGAQLRTVFADDGRIRRSVESYVRAGQEAGTLRGEIDAAAFSVVFVALLRGIGAQIIVAPDGLDVPAMRHTCRGLVRDFLESSTEETGTR